MLGLKFWVGAIFVAVCLFSCSEGGSLGGEFSEFDDFGVAFTDTATLRTSTVLLDSLPTSGKGVMLVGKYADEKLGLTSSSTFFQMFVSGSFAPDEDAVFDSLVMVLPYSGYYFGDTTQLQTFSFNRVTSDFTTYSLPQNWIDEEQYSIFFTTGIYNNRSMPDETITTFSLRPKPHTDTVTVRLPNTLGTYWLEEGKKENGVLENTSYFQNVYKGFSIRNESGQGTIFGFTTNDVKFRLYYSEYENGLLVQKNYALTYNSNYQQYNNITSDRAGTPLATLSPESESISSALTGEETYIQSGVGLVTKIEFPYLATLQNLSEYTLINNAYLVIEPVKNSWSETKPLPEKLILFATNKTNLPTAPLYIDYSTETQQSASITYDTEYGTNSGYKFSITEYVQYQVKNGTNNGAALLLTTASPELFNTVDRIYLGGAKHPDYTMRLEIYYTRKN